MLKRDARLANMANPSWCLAVMTMYFMPARWAMLTHSSALNRVGLNRGARPGVLGDWNRRFAHDPGSVAPDLLSLPGAGRNRVQSPVDEHAELGLLPPPHALVYLRAKVGITPIDGRAPASSGLRARTTGSWRRKRADSARCIARRRNAPPGALRSRP